MWNAVNSKVTDSNGCKEDKTMMMKSKDYMKPQKRLKSLPLTALGLALAPEPVSSM